MRPLLLFLLLLTSCEFWAVPPVSDLCAFFPERPTPGAHTLIAHAGGSIHSYTYTNSREAVERAIAAGYRFIELDLQTTADGKLVAAHDWTYFNLHSGHPELKDTAPTLNDFKSRKLRGSYTPLTGADIEAIFTKNPQLILVTDKIRDFKLLAESFSFPERMVVEVFSMGELEKARSHGLTHAMLSLDETLDSQAVLSQHVGMVAVPAKLLVKHADEFEALTGAGVCVWAFTSNEDRFITEQLRQGRATAFYTDHWDLEKGTCDMGADCQTY